ncbi:hypothetical protein [Cohnella boryungensis]|uniref:DUF3679 domain-containing protein n=1 Tax=Cohnella boryungensis TaxID=768479 RepID=A0ABV8SEB5_9BACL
MRRDSFRLLIFAGILGFAILYGMELSSKGIESVQGSLSSEEPSGASGEEDWTLPATGKARGSAPVDSQEGKWSDEAISPQGDEEEPTIPRNDREPIVDRVSGRTAEVLHDLSRNGIRMVVSLFDKVLG